MAISDAARRAPPRQRLTLHQQDVVTGFLLVLPSVLIILGISFLPILVTLIISFTSTPIADPTPQGFVGLQNYLSFLASSVFWQAIGRTAYFTLASVGLELVLGLAIASLINSHPPGWKFLRVSLIIPWAVPTIVNGALWRWIYNADYGSLNALLTQVGIIEKYIPWLIDPLRAMNLIVIADIWHSVPFIALVLQAAMAGIPAEIEEAAAVDGAGIWQRFFSIRLPLLRSAILVALVIRTVEAFRVFDIIYVLTNGGPAFGTVTISFLTYLETFSYGHLGRGASLSFLISIFTIILAMIYIRLLYRPEVNKQ